MGNHNSSSNPHEPLDRIQSFNAKDFKTKSSVRSSFRRSVRSSALSPPRAGMDRLRRSFRESFRRRKTHDPPESARPHVWQADEQAVRAGTCTFPVKYLGCVEVFESRGMQVCEDALKILRNSRRRPVRAILHVSGDGLRVVEEETKGLIVDQTIEKVSFCAPDRNHERGFSYICRDGTTRRWMCHGFVAARDGGERLSHAVGCAFAACLERKQRRDKECAVSMSIDAANHAFTRQGSFRHTTMTEARSPPSTTKPHNPFAVERPRAAPALLQRQGSLRALNNASPFKRQLSLRITDLPSHIERRSDDLSKLAQQLPGLEDTQNKENNNSLDPVAAMCAALTSELRALAEEPVAAREPLPHPDAWLGRVAPTIPTESPLVAPIVIKPPVAHLPPRRAHSFAAPSPTPPTPLNTNPFLAH